MFLPKKNIEEADYRRIIIRYDEKITLFYSFKTYNKYPFLQNYIKKKDFNNILDKANIIIYDAKIKKKNLIKSK